MRFALGRLFPLFVLPLLLITSIAMAADPAVIEACVNAGNGNLRLVDASVACHSNETRVLWNVVGPAGPAGPAGSPGAPGTPGTNGVNGQDAGGPPYVWACTPVNYG